MGSIYTRGNVLWFKYRDASGAIVRQSSDFVVGQEAKAKAVLRRVEALIQHGESPVIAQGSLTLERYAKAWIERRKQRGVESYRDDQGRLEHHVLPELGDMLLTEVRPSHVRDLVRMLRTKESSRGELLAPRSVRAIYFTLQNLFREAVADELIPSTPAVLLKHEMPKKVDKDPTWRATAVFTHEEIEQLISDPRIPDDRRVFYALLFVGCHRFGEASAQRWGSYDPTLKPLGRLIVAHSYSTRSKRVKSVKTENPRTMPVHPVLAKILEEWRADGWPAMFGRAPTAEDLIVPSREAPMRNRSVTHGLKRFHEDLERIGLRVRRQHDSRRTFVSLCQADGATKDLLRWSTHGPKGDIMDAYTTLPWAAQCEPVMKLRIRWRDAPSGGGSDGGSAGGSGGGTDGGSAAGAFGAAEALGTVPGTATSTAGAKNSEPPETTRVSGGSSWRAVRDSNPWPPA